MSNGRIGFASVLAASVLVVCLVLQGISAHAGEEKMSVLCSTFPMYQITRNVTKGRDGIHVSLLLPGETGCPHDYALTPQDMQKLARAHVLVVNGLGLEEFLGAPLKKANARLVVLDSSAGIKETLHFAEEGSCKTCTGCKHHHHEKKDEHTEEAHGDHEGHGDLNPHLFASPRMAAKLAMNIAAGLSKADTEGAGTYFKNAKAYSDTLNRLADEMADLGKRLKNNRIVQPHGIFDYLARDMGVEIAGVVRAHGQEPSAAEMIQLVKTIKARKVGAIFTEPQYPEKAARTLAKETGIPVAMLDPVATGPDNAPIEYYETVMRKNMKTLETTLGVK